MIDLVYGSFLVVLLPIVLHVCVRILSVAAGALVWRSDRPAEPRIRTATNGEC